ncbi:MAG TPA: lytic transglycosylase, partial [Woeseiaceae bacterium]
MTSPRRLIALVLLLVATCVTLEGRASETFPKPPELEPDVAFWVAIFTRYDSDEGVLHDSRNLAVIYERIDIPEGSSARDRHRRVDARRQHYRKILEQLAATSDRTRLSEEQQRVLALWPRDVSRKVLARAASDIRFQQGLADRFRAGLARAGRYREFVRAEFA